MKWGRADRVMCMCCVLSKSEFYSPVEIFFPGRMDSMNQGKRREGLQVRPEKGCAYTLSHVSHVWLFATPCTVAFQVPLSMGFSRQKDNWSELSCPPPGDLPNPGTEPHLLSPALAGGLFTTNVTWEARRELELSFYTVQNCFAFCRTFYCVMLFKNVNCGLAWWSSG